MQRVEDMILVSLQYGVAENGQFPSGYELIWIFYQYLAAVNNSDAHLQIRCRVKWAKYHWKINLLIRPNKKARQHGHKKLRSMKVPLLPIDPISVFRVSRMIVFPITASESGVCVNECYRCEKRDDPGNEKKPTGYQPPGPRLNIKTVFSRYGISILKIRRSRDVTLRVPAIVSYSDMRGRTTSNKGTDELLTTRSSGTLYDKCNILMDVLNVNKVLLKLG